MAGEALRRCVGDTDDFATRHWGRRPLLRRSIGGFDDLLDVAAIEVLLTDLGRRPTFRLVRDGDPLPITTYTVRTRVGGTEVDDVADVDRILEHVANGATLVMQGLHRSWAPLNRFCLDLEADVGHAVQANAYLSPASAAGLSRHTDDHDVLVLQVSGQKQWDIAGMGDVHVAPGDVVYLPAGTQHAARTTSVSSLHITIGILTTTMRDVLRRAVDALDDAELDRPLPIGYTRREQTEHVVTQVAAGIAAAAHRLADADPHELAAREVARRTRRARRRWTGRLAVVVDPAAIDDTTLVRRRHPFDLALDDDRVLLTASDRRLSLPASTSSALRHLSAPVPVKVGDLPELDEADRSFLVRRLVREGVVEIVPP